MTGSYCLSKKSHVSHHIMFITVCAQNVRFQYERKHVYAEAKSPSAHSITVWFRVSGQKPLGQKRIGQKPTRT